MGVLEFYLSKQVQGDMFNKGKDGVLTFPFTIKNQLTTTLSTLKAASSLRKELLTYMNDFFTLIILI